MSLTKPTVVALLPMKGHSERVPGKNFRPLKGKPLFRWMLDSLVEVPEIDKVVINTDARSLLQANGLIESARVQMRDRRPEICGDFVSMNRVLEDDVNAVPADIYIMTHVTNPLLTAATIKNALQSYMDAAAKGDCDSLFTVNRYQSRFYRRDGTPVNHDPAKLIRTQDLEPLLEENSNLYIFTRESFASTRARIGKKPMLFETPPFESIDIDDHNSWKLAEMFISASQPAI